MHFYFPPQKTHSVWFISVLNYGDTENVLINHLLLVIPMSYSCHYTNLCPHKPHKHAHTHTHTHTHYTETLMCTNSLTNTHADLFSVMTPWAPGRKVYFMRMKVTDVKTSRHIKTLLEIEQHVQRHLTLLQISGSRLVCRRSVLITDSTENNAACR